MRALDLKLLRDLWKMKGQAAAIALVIVSGISAFIMLISTMTSLNLTRNRFYREYGFADVFASLKRAPDDLKLRIKEVPGVRDVETRVVAEAKLDIPGFDEPVTGRLVSVPDKGVAHINRLYIRRGRMVEAFRADEAVVSEAFAEAHGFVPGDHLGAVINGRWKTLKIVGIALSPEFVMQARPGAISPDYKRYAILWMGRDALGTAYGMKGAFNDVVVRLAPGADAGAVITRIDGLLDRYGGLGAYTRKDQMSNRFLDMEFLSLQRSAEIFPAVFMVVASFLLNVVINRTVSTQREQIAALKAFGYSNRAVGVHYIKLVFLIVLIGCAGGIAVGAYLGRGLGRIYMEFYRFPYLNYELRPGVAATAVLVTFAAALAGTLRSVQKAAGLPPAEAMRPEPPALYRKTLIDRLGLGRFLSRPGLMIVRNIERRPVNSILSVTGIALSCAIMLGGTFFTDAFDFIIYKEFKKSRTEDMTVVFTDPTSHKAVYDLMGIYGVKYAEPFRTIPVKLRAGHRSYRTTIQGITPGSRLYIPYDTEFRPIRVPPEGIVLTDYLGRILGVRAGDTLTVEVLEGVRPVREVTVARLASQYIGVTGYMDISAMNRMMKEGRAISGAYLTVDERHRKEIYRSLVEMARVSGAVVRREEIKNFYATQAEILLFFTFIASLLAGT
ncbi:MAG TPA: ABC transporter permease, partial [Thermodesulfobacteriota bacterium]|nr:ABC transporter permease [Thermodesulfobacteriota bacterium]